ncbi:hypothetical protein T12_3358 [Trichinella patagoniensis]|uniref:Uncharacterized protein n=1 Tax=Trichinella patagoniensis TaxID=990121 RepID=A0A0V0ZGE8_9BILA|nr:hypothetical protein T12_433 [Trichinella patagoniensis]KRY18317.1 hypothetical protein T12_3358 [Trichinella patagoniensis]
MNQPVRGRDSDRKWSFIFSFCLAPCQCQVSSFVFVLLFLLSTVLIDRLWPRNLRAKLGQRWHKKVHQTVHTVHSMYTFLLYGVVYVVVSDFTYAYTWSFQWGEKRESSLSSSRASRLELASYFICSITDRQPVDQFALHTHCFCTS